MLGVSGTLYVFLALSLSLSLCLSLYLCSLMIFEGLFIISFQNMYGYRGLWSLRAEIMIIFEVMTDTHSQSHIPIPLIDSAHLVGWAANHRFCSMKLMYKRSSLVEQRFSFLHWNLGGTVKKTTLYNKFPIYVCMAMYFSPFAKQFEVWPKF